MDKTTFKHMMSNRERLPDPMRAKKEIVGYRRAGTSGLKFSELSLGFWHNFGSFDSFENMRDMVFTAFDSGITTFDLADNYGPRNGSAEENFGKIVKENFRNYRDEMLIATKAGFPMWPGPYGNGGTAKHLTAALNGSLARLGLDYVDIFYHHRPDPDTPIEETCYALHRLTEKGKALYIGVSYYSAEQTLAALKVFRELHTPFLVNQACYNLLDRTIERNGLKEAAEEEGFAIVAYSPLAQGLLTDRYANGIPADSRMKKSWTLKEEALTPALQQKLQALRDIACERGQTLPELALSWTLKDRTIASVIVGASSSAQLTDNLQINCSFTEEELRKIEDICNR